MRGTISRIWSQKGSRPIALQQQEFEWVYTFGAVCPARSKAVAVVMPYANTEAMNVHLKEISQGVKTTAHAVVVLDKAGWHTTKGLKIPKNLTLLELPPYSPQLNPAEHLWDWMRRHHLSNRTYEGYKEIVNACCESWLDLIADRNRLRSMCWFPWIKEAET